jgi:hypothetical protein
MQYRGDEKILDENPAIPAGMPFYEVNPTKTCLNKIE